jgi:Na+-transporting NADH:ubiquinone oxidoreductase subunit NqrA
MKGRIAALTVSAFLALAGSAGAATFTPHVLCGASCGTMLAKKGAGTLRLAATGTAYGSVASGTIAIQDRSYNGHRDFSVTGASNTWKKDGFVFYSGRNLTYYVTTTWTLKIFGKSGITSSATAQGYGFIKGSGSWSRNGHGSKSWPATGQSFVLSATS